MSYKEPLGTIIARGVCQALLLWTLIWVFIKWSGLALGNVAWVWIMSPLWIPMMLFVVMISITSIIISLKK